MTTNTADDKECHCPTDVCMCEQKATNNEKSKRKLIKFCNQLSHEVSLTNCRIYFLDMYYSIRV